MRSGTRCRGAVGGTWSSTSRPTSGRTGSGSCSIAFRPIWCGSTTTRAISASLGYDPVEEFAAYGARLGSVHVKDRVLGGTTVDLGSGDTRFDAVFDELARMGYDGDFVLQTARGESGDEMALAARNLELVRAYRADRA